MRIVGLMSGTSIDGIDAALVEVTGEGYNIGVSMIRAATYPYEAVLRSHLLQVCAGQPLSMEALSRLDDAVADAFAEAALAIADSDPVDLVASHGQTIYHRPPSAAQLGYSLQIGRGSRISIRTGWPTVSNFRVADIALGGQGAPLVPPVDACLLSHPQRYRCVQNLGGIGNVAYLPAWDRAQSSHFPEQIQGWDTGPANVLIDWAVTEFSDGVQTYDRGGRWAAQGQIHTNLVDQWLDHPFFSQPPPKSTGRELFGADYARQCWRTAQANGLSQADFLASLTELTAASIERGYRRFLPQLPDEVLLCGGGSQNAYLRKRLQTRLPETQLVTTSDVGLSADYKEAVAFAILGFWRWHRLPGNLPAVTGARSRCLLGEIALPQ
ncbi:MAG: anhydro-N-acetylmuramic acid kinase [Cyanobacteria bacterium P01_D01_bin.14]